MTRVEFSDTASSTPPLLPLRANAPSPDELITSVPVPPVAWIAPEFDSLLARLPITRSTPLPVSVLPLKMSRSISIWLVLLAMSKSPPAVDVDQVSVEQPPIRTSRVDNDFGIPADNVRDTGSS